MAAYSHDDGFHEIQLNGKQLVFLFMAATVVSVVIFLCGVLVGRGVRAARGDLAEPPPTELAPLPSATIGREAAPPGAEPGAPPPPVDELSYFDRLGSEKPAPETLARPEAPPATARGATRLEPARPPSESDPLARPAPPETRSAAAPPPAAAPAPGYAVQVAALNARSEADAMARRLSAKGYDAYVVSPANGNPAVFRVRIGTYKTRREAEAMASRLQKEEQIKPWVTR